MANYASKFYLGISSKWFSNIHKHVKAYNDQHPRFPILILKKDNETIYLALTAALRKISHIPNQFFQLLTKKQKCIAFINVIRDNLYNITTQKFAIDDQEKTLVQWSKTILYPKNHLIRYCLLNGRTKTINYIKYHLAKMKSIQVKTDTRGYIITVNNISNNINKWSILCNYAGNYLYKLQGKFGNQHLINFIQLKLFNNKQNDTNFITINDLCALATNWSLFINEDKYYLSNMISSMGYEYTVNYLYKLINNNKNIVNNCKTITINGESLTLYCWAKKLKLNVATFYALKAKCGLDYTIKVICHILDKQNAAEKNTSEEDTAEQNIVEEISAKQTLSKQYPILNKYKCVTVSIQFSCREKILTRKKVLHF